MSEDEVTWLSPPFPQAPPVFPSPFDDVGPHPLARHCAELLKEELRLGPIAPGYSTALLRGPEGGKMFGVLVVQAVDGRIGFLRAVSGQVARAWYLDRYVAPAFDRAHRDTVEASAETVVKALTRQVELARVHAPLLEARERVARLLARQADERRALKAEHQQRKATRQQARKQLSDAAALAALDNESRRDDRQRRDAEAAAREELAVAERLLKPLERRLAALERLRRLTSQEATRRIWASYTFTSFSNETQPLRALFPQGDPPSGAGDCAAPKLLVAAQRAGLSPIALAEFWWGAAPPGGGRVEGMYFPACKEKCEPVLNFVLRGLECSPRQTWKPGAAREDALEFVHREATFAVVYKPEGLLSVPARDETIRDSVVERLQRLMPTVSGPLAVHRLDLDTSGLLLVAFDVKTYRQLQAQFVNRTVHKRYVAIVDGVVSKEEGLIDLPLRPDLEQRPRQVVDFEFGKPALTRWRVLGREAGRTRIEFFPVTGRTHQLRVHAAHRLGLNCPIVGDRLYGQPSTRLMLHAERLSLRHPHTEETMLFSHPAQF